MKKSLRLVAILSLLLLTFAVSVSAHPGRTDGNGGHTCRTNCEKWGLAYGEYHFHNGGSTSKTPAPVVKPAPAPAPKPAPITIYINGVKQVYDQPPIIENGTTLVPVRGIFEALGATVNWDQQRQLVTAQHDKTVIQLKIGSKSPTVNGKAVSISVPAQIKNGRTMVPLRFVSEALGATVNYDHLTRTITIN